MVKKTTVSSQNVASPRAMNRARSSRASLVGASRAAMAGRRSAAAAANGTSRLSGTEFSNNGFK
jgi:hypothetical protein